MPSRLVNIEVEEVSGVDAPANRRKFLVIKNDTREEDGMSEFNLNDLDLNEDQAKAVQAEIDRLSGEVETATKRAGDLEGRIAELEKAQDTGSDGDGDSQVDLEKLDEATRAEFERLQKAADEQAQRNQELADRIEKSERQQALEKAQQTVGQWDSLKVTADDFAPRLRDLRAADSELAAAVEDVLATANKAVAESNIMQEIGSDGPGATDTETRVEKLADELRKNQPELTREQAVTQVYRENPDLYDRYMSEREGR